MFNFSCIQRADIEGPDDFASPAVRRLYEWWTGFAPDIPQRKDFDVLNLADIAAHLFLVRLVEPGTFEFRLRGERVAELVGARGSGDRYSCDDADDGHRQLAEYYQSILDSRRPQACRGSFEDGVTFATGFEAVDCPLLDEAGNATHIIGAIDKGPPVQG